MTITGVQDLALLKQEFSSETNGTESNAFSEKLEEAMANNDLKEVEESCKELEGYMLAEVFKQMKKSMLTGETLVEKGDYEEMFEDSMIENICNEMVEAGGVGLAKSMYAQITKAYGVNQTSQGTPSVEAEIGSGSQKRINTEI